MKQSTIHSYDELPLFLNATMVAQLLGISESGCYKLMHSKNFPSLRVGSRWVVPKKDFQAWIEKNTVGGTDEK